MQKMIYPWRIVPIRDDTPDTWTGKPVHDTVCDANDALRAGDLINVFRADFVLSGKLTDAQWTDLIVRESYEYAGFGVGKLRPGRDHRIPPYSIPFALDGWQRAGYMTGRYRLPFTVPSECPYPRWFKVGYDDGRFDPAIIRSRNLAWGFYGTWCTNYVHQYDSDTRPELVGRIPPPSFGWARVVNRYLQAHPQHNDQSARELLDSSTGRHMCEGVMHRLARCEDSWESAIDHYVFPPERRPSRLQATAPYAA